MRAFCLIFASILLVSSGEIALADNTIPRYFEHKLGGLLWISVDDAITPEGKLRSDIRRPAHLENAIKRWHEQDPVQRKAASDAAAPGGEPCDVRWGHQFTEGPDDGAITSSAVLDELLATRSVISGTVTASALGLHSALPYTILQIDVDEEGASPNRVFLMYPRGRVRFDGTSFCNEDPAVMDLPSIGDSIVFIASYALDSAGTLYDTPLVVIETPSGTVASSTMFRLEPEARPRSVRGFAERLRATQRDKRQ